MCIDFQSIIFILILFKLGQIFSGPHRRPCVSINCCCASLLSGPLMVSREIISGRLFPTSLCLGQHDRSVNLPLSHFRDIDKWSKWKHEPNCSYLLCIFFSTEIILLHVYDHFFFVGKVMTPFHYHWNKCCLFDMSYISVSHLSIYKAGLQKDFTNIRTVKSEVLVLFKRPLLWILFINCL